MIELSMLTHDEMIGLQAEKHFLIKPSGFKTKSEYILHLTHSTVYNYGAKFSKEKIALDLGCNTGFGSMILSEVAKEVVGVDVSESAIEYGRKFYAKPGLKFKIIDGKTLPFENDYFDVITSCQVIEHIVDIENFITESKRVLKSDGLVLFTTPNADVRLEPGMNPWNKFHHKEYQHR